MLLKYSPGSAEQLVRRQPLDTSLDQAPGMDMGLSVFCRGLGVQNQGKSQSITGDPTDSERCKDQKGHIDLLNLFQERSKT
jgi:hypothetical protein